MATVSDVLTLVAQAAATGPTTIVTTNSSGGTLIALQVEARVGTLPWEKLASAGSDYRGVGKVRQYAVTPDPLHTPARMPTGSVATVLIDLTGYTEVRVLAASLTTGAVTATISSSGGSGGGSMTFTQ